MAKSGNINIQANFKHTELEFHKFMTEDVLFY
jgi:hypothetical protein